MSKNQAKKLRKQAEYEERKAATKARKKEAQREKSAAALEAKQQRIAAMSPEELAALQERREAAKVHQVAKKDAAAARREAAQTSPYNVVIDCAFDHLMEQKESKAMVHQLSLCHASNMRAAVPARLNFTSLSGALAEGHAAVCGADKWPIARDARPYLELFAERRASLVYLSADSPHELGELSSEDVYIIGGIVDRNRNPRLTLDKAEAAGIRHARLPLAAHVALAGSAVLTVNQVLELLLAWLELRDWRGACERVVPKRKRGAEAGAEERPGRKARRAAAGEARAAAGLPADEAPAADGEDDDDSEDEEAAPDDE